jgi:hypothetical protein
MIYQRVMYGASPNQPQSAKEERKMAKPKINYTTQDGGRVVATMKVGRKTYRAWGYNRRTAESRVRRGAGMSGG